MGNSVTVRELQHRLAGVLSRVEDGEEVRVRRHDKVIARIVPDRETPRRKPDFAGRFGPLAKRTRKVPVTPENVTRGILDYVKGG